MGTFRRPSFIGAMASWVLAVAVMVFGQTLWGQWFPSLSSNYPWGFLPLFGTFALFAAGLVFFLAWLGNPVRDRGDTVVQAAIASWILAALMFVFSVTVGPYLSSGTFRDFLPILLAVALFLAGVVLFSLSVARRSGARRQRGT